MLPNQQRGKFFEILCFEIASKPRNHRNYLAIILIGVKKMVRGFHWQSATVKRPGCERGATLFHIVLTVVSAHDHDALAGPLCSSGTVKSHKDGTESSLEGSKMSNQKREILTFLKNRCLKMHNNRALGNALVKVILATSYCYLRFIC